MATRNHMISCSRPRPPASQHHLPRQVTSFPQSPPNFTSCTRPPISQPSFFLTPPPPVQATTPHLLRQASSLPQLLPNLSLAASPLAPSHQLPHPHLLSRPPASQPAGDQPRNLSSSQPHLLRQTNLSFLPQEGSFAPPPSLRMSCRRCITQKPQTIVPSVSELESRSIDGICQNSWVSIEEGESARAWEISGRVAKLKRILEFSFIAIIISTTALLAVLMAYRHLESHVDKLHLVICGFLSSSTLLCGITLMFFTIVLLSRQNPSIPGGQYRALLFHLVISCALLILTASSFLALLHKPYIFVAALVTASLLLGTLCYFIIQTGDEHNISGFESNKSELKQSLSLSSSVTSLASSGLISTLLGISRNPSGQALSKNMDICILHMFFTSIFGLLLMLLSSAPPRLNHQSTRDSLAKVLKAFSYVLLGSLSPIAATAASAFLHGYLVLVLFLVPSLGVMVWFFIECCTQRERPDIGTIELKLISKVATTTTSISFGGMMGIFSGFLGSKSSELQLKILMLVMYFAFLSSFTLKLLPSRAPKAGILITVINILNICSFLFLAIAAIVVCFVEFLAA